MSRKVGKFSFFHINKNLPPTSIAFGNAVPNFSPNDGKGVFMVIEPRMINVVVTRRC